MLFKTTRIKGEWQLLHTQVRRAWTELDSWIQSQGWPQVTMTDIGRTPAENFSIYLKKYLADGLEQAIAEQRAAARFTYHFSELMQAADGRGAEPWTGEQYDSIFKWARERCPVGQFELLTHDVGAGMHLHIGLINLSKRHEWERKHRPGAGWCDAMFGRAPPAAEHTKHPLGGP